VPWLLKVILYVLQSPLLSCVFSLVWRGGGGWILCFSMLIIIQSIGFVTVFLFYLTEKSIVIFFFDK
jgi:hypothetical protein